MKDKNLKKLKESKPKKPKEAFGLRLVYAFLDIVLVLLVISLIITNVGVSRKTTELNTTISSQEDTIETLSKTLDTKEEDVVKETDDGTVSINSADKTGEEIAKLQNDYVGSDFEEGEKIAEKLSPYFDSIENTGTNVLPNGRWFDDINYTTGSTPVWTFNTPYGFTGHSINVIWLCHDSESGDLLAYTTAIYNADTGLYSNVEITETEYGLESTQTNTDTSTSVKDQIIEDSDRYIESMGGIK